MSTVDIGVCARQAFGASFESTRNDQLLRDALLTGNLTLAPHPSWQIPETLTWREDPFNQSNWRAQFHMLRWLDVLRRSALKGDDEARAAWVRYALSWIDHNPPSRTYDYYPWSDMVDAIRSLELVFGYAIVPDEHKGKIQEAITQHGEWISRGENLGHSNHALHQHQALLVIGAFLRNRDWARLAVHRLESLFETAYDAEGINDEGSIAYHLLNLRQWTDAFRRIDLENIPHRDATDVLQRAATALAHATRPDGLLERIGDTEVVRPSGLSAPELEYVGSNGSNGTPPGTLTAVYSRGYIFGRSGWGEYARDFSDETFYSISFGAANRVHGHADGGSVTLYADRGPWLVDSGKYGYMPNDPMRKFVLGRSAHNVVTIQDKAYNKSAFTTLLRHSSNVDVDDYVILDTGYDGVRIERRVIYCRGGDFMVVIDTVRSQSEITAEQLWHLDPSVEAIPVSRGFELVRGQDSARVAWFGTVPDLGTVRGSTEPVQGWVATGWGKKQEATVLVARRTGDRFRFLTLVGSGDPDHFGIERADSGGGRLRLRVKSRGLTFDLEILSDSVQVTHHRSNATQLKSSRASLSVQALLREITQRLGTKDAPAEFRIPALEPINTLAARARAACSGDVADESRLLACQKLAEGYLSLGPEASADHGIRAALIDLLGDIPLGPQGQTIEIAGFAREPAVPCVRVNEVAGSDRPKILTLPDAARELRAGRKECQGALQLGELVLPFVAGNGEGDTVCVRLHGAIDRTRMTLPVFPGVSTSRSSNRPYLIFQDPSLDLNSKMTLAWYLGRPNINLYLVMAECIETISSALGMRRVLLTGSSGGGFAAMQVATYLQDASVLAFNPQTDIRAYHAVPADRALTACLDSGLNDSLPSSLESRVNLRARIAEATGGMHVTYVQNVSDQHHVQQHQEPLRRVVQERGLDESFEFVSVDWGPGHVAVSAQMFSDYLKVAMEPTEQAAGSALGVK